MTPQKFSDYMTLLIMVEHVWFMMVEIFLWKKTIAHDVLGYGAEEAELTAPFAMNMGIYNGFLAAGLLWAYTSLVHGHEIRLFFLSCITIAGLMGGRTINKKIYLFQALPAGFTLAFIWLVIGT